jgi:hypothetical protein
LSSRWTLLLKSFHGVRRPYMYGLPDALTLFQLTGDSKNTILSQRQRGADLEDSRAAIKAWLKVTAEITLVDGWNSLVIGKQFDDDACGIFALNAIERDLCPEHPLVTTDTTWAHRLRYFIAAMDRLAEKVATFMASLFLISHGLYHSGRGLAWRSHSTFHLALQSHPLMSRSWRFLNRVLLKCSLASPIMHPELTVIAWHSIGPRSKKTLPSSAGRISRYVRSGLFPSLYHLDTNVPLPSQP